MWCFLGVLKAVDTFQCFQWTKQTVWILFTLDSSRLAHSLFSVLMLSYVNQLVQIHIHQAGLLIVRHLSSCAITRESFKETCHMWKNLITQSFTGRQQIKCECTT